MFLEVFPTDYFSEQLGVSLCFLTRQKFRILVAIANDAKAVGPIVVDKCVGRVKRKIQDKSI